MYRLLLSVRLVHGATHAQRIKFVYPYGWNQQHGPDGEFSSILAAPCGYLMTLSARASTFAEL